MFPFIPFAAGVLTGMVGLRLLRTDKTKAGLEKAQESLRNATVSSLASIEQASARARERLQTVTEPSEVELSDAEPAQAEPAALLEPEGKADEAAAPKPGGRARKTGERA